MKTLLTTMLLAGASLASMAQNPYLPLWEHLPDGEPRVFEDPDRPGKYRAYIIGSHDTHYTEYCGNDIRMWSAPVEDLSKWEDEGPIFSYFIDGHWDTMFAPDLVEVNDRETGKRTYYLYPHSRGWRRVPMVCKSDRPDGPFTPINLTADGRACVEGSLIDFDPSVFIENIDNKKDKDYKKGFRAYVFYGFHIPPPANSTKTRCIRNVPALSSSTRSSLQVATMEGFWTSQVLYIRLSPTNRTHWISTFSRLRQSVRLAIST